MKSELVLVDLDNLYFTNGAVNIPMLLKRIATIDKLLAKKRWFCNESTASSIKRAGVAVPQNQKLEIVDNTPDNADHALLHVLKRLHKSYSTVHVISNDKTLLRLGYFISQTISRLRFYRFRNARLEDVTGRVDICFKTNNDLTKFIDSYNLYNRRYGSNGTK